MTRWTVPGSGSAVDANNAETEAAGAEYAPTSIELEFEPPYQVPAALATLAAHAIPGSEITDVAGEHHTRILSGADGPIAATVRFGDHSVTVSANGEPEALSRLTPLIRWWLDLDADPQAVHGVLGTDPTLAPLLARRPGLRVIGYPDGFEAAVTTVLGQQVSVAACRTFAGRLVKRFGKPGPGGLTIFPTAESIAASTPAELQSIVGLTGARSRSLHALAEACAGGLMIGRNSDSVELRRDLIALPGIGPWSVDYLAVRALGDRDAFVSSDLVLRRALGKISAREAEVLSRAWSPVRAYALFHLWTQAAYLI